MPAFNLEHLRTLADVVELGSFSAAARRRRLTQPAVSLQVRQLERRVGVRLVERVGRRAVATAAGAALLGHGRRIEAEVSAALDGMAQYARGAAGRVRLGTGATACTYLLPPVLRELRRRFAALDIVVRTGNTSDILRAVEENSLDVGLVTLPARGRMVEVTPVVDDEFVLIAARRGRELPPVLTPAAVAALPLVLFESAGNTRRVVDEWFRQAGLRAKPIMELGSVEAIKELVAAGLGYAVLPRMALPRRPARAPLVARSMTPPLHRTLAVVVRRDKPRYRGLRETIDALGRLSPAVRTAVRPTTYSLS